MKNKSINTFLRDETILKALLNDDQKYKSATQGTMHHELWLTHKNWHAYIKLIFNSELRYFAIVIIIYG